MKSAVWKIEKLREWDKNPRRTGEVEFERLMRQIEKFGQYKPLIVTPDGLVLGGNARLRAYKEIGYTDIWVSIVEPKTEAERLKYSLSDNDMVGRYQPDAVQELLKASGAEREMFTLSAGTPLALSALFSEPKLAIEKPVPLDTVYRYQFTFPMDEYREVLSRLIKVITENDLQDNTEAFIFLMKKYEKNK